VSVLFLPTRVQTEIRDRRKNRFHIQNRKVNLSAQTAGDKGRSGAQTAGDKGRSGAQTDGTLTGGRFFRPSIRASCCFNFGSV